MSGIGLVFLRRGGQAHPTAGSDYILSATKGDPEVFRILKSKGVSLDGVGITLDDATKVKSIYTWFAGTSIKDFSELRFFSQVQSLEGSAFQNATLLEYIDCENVTTMKGNVFKGCTALKRIDCRALVSVGDSAFSDCTALEEVEGDRIESIFNNAFRNCTALRSIDASHVTTLNNYCFMYCRSLVEMDCSAATAVKTNVFNGCTGLKRVYCPNATTIGDSAFSGCTSLEEVRAGAVTSMSNNAFRNCTALKRMFLTADVPPTISGNSFYGITECVFYVPDASVDAYKTASYWSVHADRIKPLSEYQG